MDVVQTFSETYTGFARYMWQQVTLQNEGGLWRNFFWMFVLLSVCFMILEWVKPWRKNQSRFRKDFWLDAFYMFFNVFIFSVIIYQASATVLVDLFNTQVLNLTGVDLSASNPMFLWPSWAVLLTGFVLKDFTGWWIHRLLHRVPFLWRFHKLHHSVEQMGFAAHLRYHWMETIVYNTIYYIPMALLGIDLYDFFLIHIFTLAWGHYNHANVRVSKRLTGAVVVGLMTTYAVTTSVDMTVWPALAWIGGGLIVGWFVLGPFMKYLFNSPEMHIWHHAHDMPKHSPYGINYGLTLAMWDYIFGTAHVPHSGRDIRLGFPGVSKYPQRFFSQITSGFTKSSSQGE